MEYVLENSKIKIKVNTIGAELKSLYSKGEDKEYMWCGDAHFWNRTSPILFPVVGCYKDFKCIHEGKTYELPQHGFARDMEFCLLKKTESELWLRLEDTEETIKNYPFSFILDIGYCLNDNQVEVFWSVNNPSKEDLYFSIGGHPGFNIPSDTEDGVGCYLWMNAKEGKVVSRKIRNRMAIDGFYDCALEDGIVPVTKELFKEDALVLENHQISKVALLNSQKKSFLEVEFSSPLVGIWAPAYLEEKAPFVCIEPWYGRCDHENFHGDLKDREWGNTLKSGETFKSTYKIIVLGE